MHGLSIQGDAFSEYFLDKLLWEERRLRPHFGDDTVNTAFRRAASIIRSSQRDLRDRHQARSTDTLLLRPLAELLGWKLGEHERIQTEEEDEDAGFALLRTDGTTVARVRPVAPDAHLDVPPLGLHRRFAPTLSLVRVLEETGLTWGVLLTAHELRIVRRAEAFVASHLAFDLRTIAEGGTAGVELFRLLWALFRQEAWDHSPTLADEAVTIGRDNALKVSNSLGKQAEEAILAFASGVLAHPENQHPLGQDHSTENLAKLYRQALRFIYRLLFILYAEARGLLPLDILTYREGYSLKRLVKIATDPATNPRRAGAPASVFLTESVRALFELLRTGCNLGPEGQIPAYSGGLFNKEENEPFSIDSIAFDDKTVATVLEKLTRLPSDRGLVPISYKELDVEQLGSVYENLLERSIAIAAETMFRVRLDGNKRELVVNQETLDRIATRRRIVGLADEDDHQHDEDDGDNNDDADNDADADTGDDDDDAADVDNAASRTQPARGEKVAKVTQQITAGTLFLKSTGTRKQTGSYYTNQAFVEFLVRETLDPLAKEKSPAEILNIKVVDPAMGSGHFLVGAIRRLSEHLLGAYTRAGQEEAHPDVARVWYDEDRALASCRLLIAGNCIYGVDKNPLAVELARVAIWLSSAATDHPLTFLDHRLRCGDSLLGLPADELLKTYQTAPRRKGSKKGAALVVAEQTQEYLFSAPTQKLKEKVRRALTHLKTIRTLVEEHPGDFAGQRQAFASMQGELQPFITLHDMRVGLAFLQQVNVELINDCLRDIGNLERISDANLERAQALIKEGKRLQAFSWELEFPEVFFNEEGEKKDNGGFDAVVGNPPWDKFLADEREFFQEYDPTVWDVQGQERRRLVSTLCRQIAGLDSLWEEYELRIKNLSSLLVKGGVYSYQIAIVDGRKTAGHADTFKFFTERAFHLLRPSGRAGIIVPIGLQMSLSCTGLRRLLLDQCQLRVLCKLDNERFIFPGVFHGQKFDLLVFEKGGRTQIIDAAFFSWERASVLNRFRSDKRFIQIEADLYRRFSPDQYVLTEIANQMELQILEHIHSTFPGLGEEREGTWNVSFGNELNMTNDAFLFRDAALLLKSGANLHSSRSSPTLSVARADFIQSDGGQYWVTPEADWYLSHGGFAVPVTREIDAEGRVHLNGSLNPDDIKFELSGFVQRGQEEEVDAHPVRPNDKYIPLYEGRLVHQFDYCKKAYVSGSGRRARWDELPWESKEIIPHYFVSETDATSAVPSSNSIRLAICGVTGQTNERTVLASMIPPYPSAHSINTCCVSAGSYRPPEATLFVVSLLCSFVFDFLGKKVISNNASPFILKRIPAPREIESNDLTRVAKAAGMLTCATRHMSPLWDELAGLYPEDFPLPWCKERACLDPRARATLRAEIDALIASMYRLSALQYAQVLSRFTLLDRDQPALPNDSVIRETKRGIEKNPRSFITRDLALLTFIRHKGEVPPNDIVEFFAQAGMDISQQTGPIRNLEERVAEAERLGAVAYVPSE